MRIVINTTLALEKLEVLAVARRHRSIDKLLEKARKRPDRAPAICVRDECSHMTRISVSRDRVCERCGEHTIVSCLDLAQFL